MQLRRHVGHVLLVGMPAFLAGQGTWQTVHRVQDACDKPLLQPLSHGLCLQARGTSGQAWHGRLSLRYTLANLRGYEMCRKRSLACM